MVLLTRWLLLTLLLVANRATAQSQPPARQRQDRRAALPTTPTEPIPELYVAAGNLTTVAFNGPLDRDSLVMDRTRFKWVDVGDRILSIEPFTDLGPGERLIMQVGFKDRALPTKAVLAVVSKADVMDGKVEVDRRANTPEALLAALTQKEAELEELKTRYAESGPAGLVLSEWLGKKMNPLEFFITQATANGSGLTVVESIGYEGASSTLIAIRLRNLPGQKRWVAGKARITSATGAPVEVFSVHTKQEQLAPGEAGLVVLEMKAPPWSTGRAFSVELEDASVQRRLSFNLLAQ
ncbi:DUF2381 family protein [Stigmatella erecta]|uniref:Myxococcus xanthus paralogous family TIGR02268 n=1 Tax=Stigmatella erecta TaxID=83460 RepID=A0A1I0K498_9BACT|nr:DUF2381 family protein [Stigmatella erecta]SEU18621.1 Myxococcus xanthus paralogous family TIGR02268 [Stigmatella erecta]